MQLSDAKRIQDLRVVIDTNVLISALVFQSPLPSQLRKCWQVGQCTPLANKLTIDELIRVLNYGKFKLSASLQQDLLSDYLPYVEVVEPFDTTDQAIPICRDPKDQMFIDLSHHAKADYLISGDLDLLALQGQTPFQIQPPAAFIQQTLLIKIPT